MKRRNVESGKPRRTLKRANKFAEGVYGSNSFIYLKLISVWFLVLVADFVLEFRFEYLWPLWLLLRSVCDSFKYQGLALSVVFVCVAVASDTICFLFIPVQWLFFMASTYVWVQYIWHTDRGICLPTVTLWLLFMYIEASIRLKDLRNSPFQVDLCRPFAAHCIGYPVVTLGFGLKSYVQYRWLMRTQQSVQKENDFYFELLQHALPIEQRVKPNYETKSLTNGLISHSASSNNIKKENQQRLNSLVETNSTNRNTQTSSTDASTPSKTNENINNLSDNHQHSPPGRRLPHQRNNNFSNTSGKPPVSSSGDISSSKNDLRKRNTIYSPNALTTTNLFCKGSSTCGNIKVPSLSRSSSISSTTSTQSKSLDESMDTMEISNNVEMAKPSSDISIKSSANEENVTKQISTKEDSARIEKLESLISELRVELDSTRRCEGDLRSQNYTLFHGEKSAKNELSQLRRDNDQLQTKLHNLVNIKQKDKHTVQTLEKRLKAEMEIRESIEKILKQEQKKRKEEEETAARAVALASSNRDKEEAEMHRRMNHELDKELQNLKKEFVEKEDGCKKLKKEIDELKQREKAAKESETLMSALAAMQEKNMMLEKSLSAETRLKLDLFSALGDVKRQLEIAHNVRCQREVEIRELKSRVAEVLSVLPESQMRASTPHYSANFLEKQGTQPPVQLSPTQHYSAAFCTVPVASISPQAMDPLASIIHPNPIIQPSGMIQQMPLDPNAAMYTPSPSSTI